MTPSDAPAELLHSLLFLAGPSGLGGAVPVPCAPSLPPLGRGGGKPRHAIGVSPGPSRGRVGRVPTGEAMKC